MRDRTRYQAACRGGSRMVRALAVLLWFVAAGAAAAPAYRCTDAQGHVAFQDTPCATHARQEQITLAAQPLIGHPGERVATTRPPRRPAAAKSPRKRRARTTAVKPPMAWECRVADGEVFYQHTRCPASVPGNGEVRVRFADSAGWKRKPKRERARGRLAVHGVPVTRAEACRRMEPVRAAGRDGHLRDQRGSTYDRLMGRDPCNGQ